MSALLPAAVYGLEVPPGDVMIPCNGDYNSHFRITMAAIDPTASPVFEGNTEEGAIPRATLKIIRVPMDIDDEDDEEEDYSDIDDDLDGLDALVNGDDSEEDEEDDENEEEEAESGPSKAANSKKSRNAAAAESLRKAVEEADQMSSSSKKGKGKALVADDGDEDEDMDDYDEDDEDDEDLDLELEEFVLCTLDPAKNLQQTLDITIGEDEEVYFKVTGTHAVYLTGNYVMPVDDSPSGYYDDGEDEEDEYDYSPGSSELEDEEDEDDELDDMEDPRFIEVGSEGEEEAVPKLVNKKGKNKRPAEDSDEEPNGLDDLMTKALKSAPSDEVKLSKNQQKKLKNNAGAAIAAKNDGASEGGKKVQFAKNLEQGPTPSKVDPKNGDSKTGADSAAASSSTRVVQGVTIDDRGVGKGPAAKKGSKVSMRYIGKLEDGKQFDANKSGKPFTFVLGKGEVIKGWEIGVEGMKAGGTRRITIPAPLAYGKQAQPGIPKNSTLIFDLKVLSIQ